MERIRLYQFSAVLLWHLLPSQGPVGNALLPTSIQTYNTQLVPVMVWWTPSLCWSLGQHVLHVAELPISSVTPHPNENFCPHSFRMELLIKKRDTYLFLLFTNIYFNVAHQSQDKLKMISSYLIICQLPKLNISFVLPPGLCKYCPHFLNCIFIFPACYKNLCIWKFWLSYAFLYVAFSFSRRLAVFPKLCRYSTKATSFQRPSKCLVGCGTTLKKLDMIWSGVSKKRIEPRAYKNFEMVLLTPGIVKAFPYIWKCVYFHSYHIQLFRQLSKVHS